MPRFADRLDQRQEGPVAAPRIGITLSLFQNLLDVIAGSGQLDSSGGITPVVSAIVHTSVSLESNHSFIQKSINVFPCLFLLQIDSGLLASNLAKVRAELGQRCAALSSTLKAKLPSFATFQQPMVIRSQDQKLSLFVCFLCVPAVRFVPFLNPCHPVSGRVFRLDQAGGAYERTGPIGTGSRQVPRRLPSWQQIFGFRY